MQDGQIANGIEMGDRLIQRLGYGTQANRIDYYQLCITLRSGGPYLNHGHLRTVKLRALHRSGVALAVMATGILRLGRREHLPAGYTPAPQIAGEQQ